MGNTLSTGDTVYYVSRYWTGKFIIHECVVTKIHYYEENTFLSIEDKYYASWYFGVNANDPSIFLSKSEAEKELHRIERSRR